MGQQHGLGGAGAGPGLGAALLGEQAGRSMDEGAFEVLLVQAKGGETVAVLAAVDQDKRLLTRANVHGVTLLHWSCQCEWFDLAPLELHGRR